MQHAKSEFGRAVSDEGVREPRAPLMFGELLRIERICFSSSATLPHSPLLSPILENPAPPSGGLSFGCLIHSLLQRGTTPSTLPKSRIL